MTRTRITHRSSRRHSNQANPIEPLEGRVLMHAGDRDPSWGVGGQVGWNFGGYSSYYPDALIDVANGRTVVGESLNDGARVGIVVFDGTGKPLKSFSDDGFKTQALNITGKLTDLLVQPDNKILVLVRSAAGQSLLARFNADGSLDTAFGQKLIGLSNAKDIARAPSSGDIVVAGQSAGGNAALVRYSSSGAAKSPLTTNVAVGDVRDVVVQGDGKPVVLVTQPTVDGPTKSVVLRGKSDFTGLDTTFSGDGAQTLPSQNTFEVGGELEIDAQGRILAAVVPEVNEGTIVYRLLSSNGTVDPAFAFSQSPFIIQDLAVAANTGKITVSGELFATSYGVTRFNPNGDTDTGYGINGSVYGGDGQYQPGYGGGHHDVQPDGRVLTINDQKLFRLTADDATPVGTAVLGSDGVLRITGTEAGNDLLYLLEGGGGSSLYLEFNGREFRFDRANVTRIDASMLGGHDVITASGGLYNPPEETPDQLPRTIHGGAGNDYLEGAGGKDTIAAENGNDVIHAGGGDDTIIDGPGTDLNDGGLGADTVDYSFRSGPVYVDLQGDADDGPAGEHDTVATSIEHIIGSKGNDTLVGDGRPNAIDGRGGNDTIRGGGGNDTLIGGLGQDRLFGEDGNDFLDAKDGITDLVLDGGAGTDTARKDASDPRTSVEVLV